MPLTEVIINGDFTNSTNRAIEDWTGTDLETRASSVYISGSGSSRVAELNGGTGATTVMEQTFTIDDTSTGEVSFDYALRTSATEAIDGFRFEILDSSGTVIATDDLFPTAGSGYATFTMPVNFPSSGDYTIRFTELGDNADGSGAILDNVSLLICFGAQTKIRTPNGSTLAGDLKIGDLVETQSGPKPVRWIGRRSVNPADMASDPRYAPVRICQGALGAGLPSRDLLVSRQHRILMNSPVAARMFGNAEVLLPALRLVGMPGIMIDTSVPEIDYIHILLDTHEVLFAEDAPAESLLLGQQALCTLSDDAIDELDLLFPGLRTGNVAIPPAHLVPNGHQQRKLVARIAKNNRPILELTS